MTRTIEVIVSPKGETKLETKGFAGEACRQSSRFLEEALGTVIGDKNTDEFYAEAVNDSVQIRPQT